jgi:septal ring factor EnvC (AmiA/AmiB activator)
MRRTRVAWARRVLAPLPVTLLAVHVLAIAAPAGAQADPVADADRKVAEAQARADKAADAYFDALERGNELDRDIAGIETELEQLDGEVARLRKVTAARAVEAYKRAGTPFANTFGDAATVSETVRRLAILDAVNARDRDAADAFQEARAERAARQDELEKAKAEQASTLDQLESEEAHLNEVLVRAQDDRRALAAQQAAAAAAAAAAQEAAATPAPSTPTAGPATTATTTTPRAPDAAGTPSPTPAPAAPGYVPKGGTHPHHDDPFLVCTRQRESGGNYQAYNAAGPYLGAYQFSQATWNGTANHAGRGDLVGVDPRNASQYDQDDMAWTLYQWRGKAPWNDLC